MVGVFTFCSLCAFLSCLSFRLSHTALCVVFACACVQDVSRHGRLAAERAAHEQRIGERDSFIRVAASALGWSLPGERVFLKDSYKESVA